MTRNPTARPGTRSAASIDDVFVARAFEASSWASRNRQLVTISAIALFIAAFAFFWYGRYRSSMAEKATIELSRVRATVQSGNPQLAIADLEKYVDRFGGTKTADEARLMLAQQYLMAGQTDKAVAMAEKLGGRETTPEGAQASFLLAGAYEAANSTGKAEALFLKLGSEAPYLYMKQEGLDNAARLRLASGNAAGAVEVLQRLVDLTPETAAERDVFQLRLGEARALAGVAAPAK